MTVVALPSGVKTRVQSLVAFERSWNRPGPGESVNVTLADEIDLSRGDMLVDEEKRPCHQHGISGHGRVDASPSRSTRTKFIC